MFLKEDISKFLKEKNHNLIMTLLTVKDKSLAIEKVSDRLLLTQAWVRAGKPQDKLEKLKEYLGQYWAAYIHPFTEKLSRQTLKDLITSDIGESLTKDHYLLVKEILHQKLNDYIEHHGVTALSVVKGTSVSTKSHKIMFYEVKSKFAPISIMKLTLDWIGYTYSARVTFLDIGYATKDLSEESLKKVKKQMYEISSDWREEKLNQVIQDVKFDDIILDCLIENILGYSNNN